MAGWDAAVRLVAVLAGLLGSAAAVAARGGEVGPWIVLAGVGGTALAWYGVVRPWWAAAERASDPRRIARRTERIAPGLRGQLITLSARLDGPRGAESPALLSRVAAGALGILEPVDDALVVPARPTVWRAFGSLVAVALSLSIVGRVPGGWRGLVAWGQGEAPEVVAAEAAPGETDPLARVGDLTLRYTYPAYTGLDPYEVFNSNGEVRAVPGTEVEVVARSADPVRAATLEAYDTAGTAASVAPDGRTVQGRFTVRPEEGVWRIRTWQGDEARRSPDHPIVPEADLPPDVSLDAEARMVRVAVGDVIPATWSARDDYGLARVGAMVDGQATALLWRGAGGGRVTSQEDGFALRPADLEMQAGATYRLQVYAWDNDTVSGSKQGLSEVLEVVVLDESGVAKLDEARRRALLDLLVDALGDFLEEAFPPGTRESAWSRWGRTVHDRYEPLSKALASHRSEVTGLIPELWPLEQALKEGRGLVRFTQVAFSPSSSSPANPDNVASTEADRTRAIESLEQAALYLDGMIGANAIRELRELAGQMQGEGRALADRVEAAQSAASSGMDLERVRARLADLHDALDGLRDPGMQEAVGDRADEIGRVAQAAQEALTDPAAEARATLLAQRAGDQLAELGAWVIAELNRRQAEDDEAQKEGEDLLELLEKLAEDQEGLQARSASLRDARDAALRDAALQRWDTVEAAVTRAHEGLKALRAHVDPRDRFNESSFLEQVQQQLDRLRSAASARDLPGAQEEALDAELLFNRYASRNALLRTVPSRAEAREGRAIQAAMGDASEALEALRRLDARPRPGESEALAGQIPDQGSLRQTLIKAEGMAERVIRKLPVTPRGVEESLSSAGDRMDEASSSMRSGQVMATEGSQGAAARHIRDAIEALEEAMQQAAAMSNEASGQGQGSGQGKPGGGQGGDQLQTTDIKMPEPEDEIDPDRYRSMILEGMEGELPGAYDAVKKRYYEDLVHQ